jgi:hypothetical protein
MLPQTRRSIIAGFDGIEIMMLVAGVMVVVAIAMAF